MAPSIVDVAGVRVGHVRDMVARTGCSVVLFDRATTCGVDVRGSAPGTRETDLLATTALVEGVHAVLLCGGSAYGLDAAAGVMAELEARDIGYAVGPWRVPIVPAAVVFDLYTGDGRVRPDRAMGARAVRAATAAEPAEGAVGAGTGTLVAKLAGLERARPGGTGNAVRRHGALVVGALAVCNALGNVYDARTGDVVAEPLCADVAFDRDTVLATDTVLRGGNTTLGVIVTNASCSKAAATKVAQMAHDGLARAVMPSHLTRDGDTVFACATGEIEAPLDLIGVLAADAFAEAIARGVRAARPH